MADAAFGLDPDKQVLAQADAKPGGKLIYGRLQHLGRMGDRVAFCGVEVPGGFHRDQAHGPVCARCAERLVSMWNGGA